MQFIGLTLKSKQTCHWKHLLPHHLSRDNAHATNHRCRILPKIPHASSSLLLVIFRTTSNAPYPVLATTARKTCINHQYSTLLPHIAKPLITPERQPTRVGLDMRSRISNTHQYTQSNYQTKTTTCTHP
eukprot:1179293-Prorocentrum_minimum.AAC.3